MHMHHHDQSFIRDKSLLHGPTSEAEKELQWHGMDIEAPYFMPELKMPLSNVRYEWVIFSNNENGTTTSSYTTE